MKKNEKDYIKIEKKVVIEQMANLIYNTDHTIYNAENMIREFKKKLADSIDSRITLQDFDPILYQIDYENSQKNIYDKVRETIINICKMLNINLNDIFNKVIELSKDYNYKNET